MLTFFSIFANDSIHFGYHIMAKIYSIKQSGNKVLLSLILLSIFFSSCGLFDKELKQDEHIARYRHILARVGDSLSTHKDRLAAFKAIMKEIDEDKALITPRKKNILLMDGNTYISKEYMDEEDYNNAIEYTNRIINIDSTSSRGYYSRGCVYQSIKKDSLALLDYNKAIKLDPEYTDVYYNRALIYEKQKEYEKALADFGRVAKSTPSYILDVYISRGKIYLREESYDKAIEEYDKVISLDTVNARAYRNRAEAYYKQQNFDKAIKDYTRSIKLDSTYFYSYLMRASVYEAKKDYDDAIADYKKALELDPHNEFDKQDEVKAAIKKLKPFLKK